jgi:hypothetical protein
MVGNVRRGHAHRPRQRRHGVPTGPDPHRNPGLRGHPKDRSVLLAQNRKAQLQEEETHLGRRRGRRPRPRTRAHVRLPFAQREGVQAPVEVRHRAPRLLPVASPGQGTLRQTELLQDGLEVPVFGQDGVPEHAPQQASAERPAGEEAQSEVRKEAESRAARETEAAADRRAGEERCGDDTAEFEPVQRTIDQIERDHDDGERPLVLQGQRGCGRESERGAGILGTREPEQLRERVGGAEFVREGVGGVQLVLQVSRWRWKRERVNACWFQPRLVDRQQKRDAEEESHDPDQSDAVEYRQPARLPAEELGQRGLQRDTEGRGEERDQQGFERRGDESPPGGDPEQHRQVLEHGETAAPGTNQM